MIELSSWNCCNLYVYNHFLCSSICGFIPWLPSRIPLQPSCGQSYFLEQWAHSILRIMHSKGSCKQGSEPAYLDCLLQVFFDLSENLSKSESFRRVVAFSHSLQSVPTSYCTLCVEKISYLFRCSRKKSNMSHQFKSLESSLFSLVNNSCSFLLFIE